MVKLSINKIKRLLKIRKNYLKKISTEYDADKIQNQITKCFKKHFEAYTVDFILETLTKFGDAPNVIYDDNGMFAVTSEGYQPVVCGKERITGEFRVYVKKKNIGNLQFARH